MIDAHCHLNYGYSSESIPLIVERFIQHGGKALVDISTGISELLVALTLRKQFEKTIFLSYGVHPERYNKVSPIEFPTIQKELPKELKEMSELVEKAAPVAIGETGFDIYKLESDIRPYMAIQETLFVEHLKLASEKQLPIVIHARGVHPEDYSCHYRIIEILKANTNTLSRTYFHSFAGDTALAKAILDVGGYIGINGVITYQHVDHFRQALSYIPQDRILLETDAPFLIPSNTDRSLLVQRTVNEPWTIADTAKIVARYLAKTPQDILKTTTDNAICFFALSSLSL